MMIMLRKRKRKESVKAVSECKWGVGGFDGIGVEERTVGREKGGIWRRRTIGGAERERIEQ